MVEFEDMKSITPHIASQLRKNGIFTVEGLAMSASTFLKENLKRVSARKIQEVKEEAYKILNWWFKPASKLAEERKQEIVFPTGCSKLDKLLGGGVRTRSITEFAGPYCSGKTESLLTLMVETLGKNPGFTAIYFDSEEAFSSGTRASQIAEARGYNSQEILERVIYMPVYTTDHFVMGVNASKTEIKERNVKLILIDSIIAPFRAEYIGREMLPPRQQNLNVVLRELQNLAKVFNLAVVVTNQVVDNPQALYTFDPVKQKIPTGGNIIAHNAESRIHLREAQKNRRIARLHDSSWLPEGECLFQITVKGIEDVPEEA